MFWSKTSRSNARSSKNQLKALKAEQKQRIAHVSKPRKDKLKASSITEIFPIVDWDERGNYGICEDGKILDFMRINCKNLNALSDDEANLDYVKFDKLYMTYPYDLKILAVNLPLDLSPQKKNIIDLSKRTDAPVFYKALEEEYSLLEQFSGSVDRDYYIIFFADDRQDHADKKSKIKSCLNRAGQVLCADISRKRKEQVLYKLNNMNSNMVDE